MVQKIKKIEFMQILNKKGFKGKFKTFKTKRNKKLGVYLNKNCKEYFDELYWEWLNKDYEEHQ
jgi:ribosomal protein S8